MAELPNLGVANTSRSEVARFISVAFGFRVAIKLHHWNITGNASYARHIAIDEAIDTFDDIVDRLAETSVQEYGTLAFKVSETSNPTNIIDYCNNFKRMVDKAYDIFPQSYQKSILDDMAECVSQLLYRLKRLS